MSTNKNREYVTVVVQSAVTQNQVFSRHLYNIGILIILFSLTNGITQSSKCFNGGKTF